MTSRPASTAGPPDGTGPGTPRLVSGLLRPWAACAACLFLLGCLWALAQPLAAPPDEPAQVVHAYALVHGQLIGSPPSPGLPAAVTFVRAPESLARLENESACLDRGNTVPAGCLQRMTGSGRIVEWFTYVGRYPPLYYALVGLPTLVSRSPGVVYAMRFLTAALVAVFAGLALAVAMGRSRSLLAPVATLSALTPMLVSLAGAVNPNGPEIACAVCLWTLLAVAGADHADDPPRHLVVLVCLAASALALMRALSPLWVGLAAAAAAPLFSRAQILRMSRRRDVRLGVAVTACAMAAALVWIVTAHALDELKGTPVPRGVSDPGLVHIAFRSFGPWLSQAVGNFGRLDTPAPHLSVWAVEAVVVVLVVAALARGSWRTRASLVLVILFSVAVPVLLVLDTGRSLGLVEQGRYFLPLWAGVPILAGASLRSWGIGAGGRNEVRGWWIGGSLVVLLVAGEVAAFWGTVRRYVVGVLGPLSPFRHAAAGWNPPVPAWTLDLGFLVVAGALVVVLWSGRRSRRPLHLRTSRTSASA